MWSSCKRSSGTPLGPAVIKPDIPKFDTVLLHYWSNLRRKYLSQIPTDINVLNCVTKSINFVNLGCHFPYATSAKNPRSMYARVPQAMAQFVLKIEKLSHIMGPTPILEMARAYGLRPRLWLLIQSNVREFKKLLRRRRRQRRVKSDFIFYLRISGYS